MEGMEYENLYNMEIRRVIDIKNEEDTRRFGLELAESACRAPSSP